MKLKLLEWASLAEIVSGLAVLVTLIVLIIGVNENTDVMRASFYKDYLDSLNDFQASVMVDPDALRVWDAYMNGNGAAADLEGLDQVRLASQILTVFRIYEAAYFSNRYGMLGAEEWARFETMLCRHRSNVLAARQTGLFSGTLTDEFGRHISSTCSGSAN